MWPFRRKYVPSSEIIKKFQNSLKELFDRCKKLVSEKTELEQVLEKATADINAAIAEVDSKTGGHTS